MGKRCRIHLAYAASREKQLALELNCGFGMKHVPSMLIEKKDRFLWNQNGVVYCIGPVNKNWYGLKFDNSMVNTVG